MIDRAEQEILGDMLRQDFWEGAQEILRNYRNRDVHDEIYNAIVCEVHRIRDVDSLHDALDDVADSLDIEDGTITVEIMAEIFTLARRLTSGPTTSIHHEMDCLDEIHDCDPSVWSGRVVGGDPATHGYSVWACPTCMPLKLEIVRRHWDEVVVKVKAES